MKRTEISTEKRYSSDAKPEPRKQNPDSALPAGSTISANRIKQLTSEKVDALFTESDLPLAVRANLSVMRSLETEIAILERIVK